MSQEIAQHLQGMLGKTVGVGWAKVEGAEGLFPDERSAILRAIPKRQAEFAAGRRAARTALRALGRVEVAIPVGQNRAPQWPRGIRGAITHDDGLALAAISAEGAGLGIDLTEAAALPGDTRRAILPHASEQGLDALAARAGFSAKESLFKALFPFVGTYFGFDAACVAPDPAAGQFRISLCKPLGEIPAETAWTGHLALFQGRILTAIRIEIS